MIYSVQNTAVSTRAFYDTRGQEVSVAPGAMKYVDLDQGTLDRLLARDDLIITSATFERHAPLPIPEKPVEGPAIAKPPIAVTGHFGIGDNLHQRAVMRVLMQHYEVWLHTCHFQLYHDLVERGLKLVMRPTHLHAQAKTIQRERDLFAAAQFPPVPATSRQANIGYPAKLVHQHGSILEAMFSCVGLKMPERPDFSLPIKPEWRAQIRPRIQGWNCAKPLMIHRPVVVRREWDGRSRNPDLDTYDKIYASIRDSFFVVSIADLVPQVEWIDGPEQDVDVKLHHGELNFEEMAALFSEADLVYCNAGFAPVLAQAVGTPVVVVYGGRESYRTTQRVGAHLAPTLPVDPINPCDCHSANHTCDKRIDVPPALERVGAFVAQLIAPRLPGTLAPSAAPTVAAEGAGPGHAGVEPTALAGGTLIFGTFYIDSPDRDHLTDLWIRLHTTLNPDCDFLAVDSQSPIHKFEDWRPYTGRRRHRMYFNFPDNIGHLSRPRVTQGRDGWGRAFCKGLEIACELGYEFVAHIEGDSLLRLKVGDIVKQMKAEGTACATTPVTGMRAQPTDWVETGLMFFATDYLKRSRFIERYDWPNRRAVPTPERFIKLHILDRDRSLRMMPWKAQRADKNSITKDNVLDLGLDWVTHQHDSAQQDVYRKFVENALCLAKDVKSDANGSNSAEPISENTTPKPSPLLKLNLGCGSNKLNGWQNCDAEVDIAKPLPWPNNCASHISIEHCVEHVPFKSAITFFQEAHRILAPGGVLRVTVPSLEQIAACDDGSYHQFTTKWQKLGPNKRGALHAIIYAHGHEMIWNKQLMRDVLYYAGFDDIRSCQPGQSMDPVLRGVEGHGRVIGDRFNLIESCVTEARKAGTLIRWEPEIALILGGAECWSDDLAAARALIGKRNVRYFVINDHIKTFAEACTAVTLHPDKLSGQVAWLEVRKQAGLPAPDQVWAHRKHAATTHDTGNKDWGGSSGLFAIQVARLEGFQKIIACGVPMTVEGAHFERHQKWQSAIGFRSGWIRARPEIGPYFRSMSGWTAEHFGKPDESWIDS